MVNYIETIIDSNDISLIFDLQISFHIFSIILVAPGRPAHRVYAAQGYTWFNVWCGVLTRTTHDRWIVSVSPFVRLCCDSRMETHRKLRFGFGIRRFLVATVTKSDIMRYEGQRSRSSRFRQLRHEIHCVLPSSTLVITLLHGLSHRRLEVGKRSAGMLPYRFYTPSYELQGSPADKRFLGHFYLFIFYLFHSLKYSTEATH